MRSTVVALAYPSMVSLKQRRPGSFNIVAEGAGQTAAVTIVVRPGTRRNPNLAPTGIRQVSTRDLPPAVATKTDSLQERVAQRSSKGRKQEKATRVALAWPRASLEVISIVSPSSTPPPTPSAGRRLGR